MPDAAGADDLGTTVTTTRSTTRTTRTPAARDQLLTLLDDALHGLDHLQLQGDEAAATLAGLRADVITLNATTLTGVAAMSAKTDALAREIAELRESSEAVAAKLAANEAAGAAKDAQLAEAATKLQDLTAQLAEAQGDGERVVALTAELDTIQQGLAALALPPLYWLPLAVVGLVVFVWLWDGAPTARSAGSAPGSRNGMRPERTIWTARSFTS